VPTLIVRYFRPEQAFYWRWHFDKGTPVPDPEQKSVTIHFSDSDRWSENTPQQLLRTLSVLRRARQHAEGASILIGATFDTLGFMERFTVESAIHQLTELLPWLEETGGDTVDHLLLDVTCSPGAVTLAMDQLGSTTFEVSGWESDGLVTKLIYGLAVVLRGAGIRPQATDAARVALQRGVPLGSREFAAMASQALAAEPSAMVELAILNGLHEPGDFAHLLATISVSTARDNEEALIAAQRFFGAVAHHAGETGDAAAEAAAHYNLANVCMNGRLLVKAVAEYNRARHLWPDYSRRDYWCLELAGCLFESRRYRLSSHLYKAAVTVGQDAMLDRRLGDALLFSGEIGAARGAFQTARAAEQDFRLAATDDVKTRVCDWLLLRHGPVAPARAAEAREILNSLTPSDPDFVRRMEEVLSRVDAFAEVANFNAAVRWANSGRTYDAWCAFLICALRVRWDIESWVNALKCAVGLPAEDALLSTLTAALELGGRGTYTAFREAIRAEGTTEDVLAPLDELARQARGVPDPAAAGVTVRVGPTPEDT
jgi:tetratricopeptide (TPR) repeat protein